MTVKKEVAGYKGLYTITDKGIVESMKRNGTLGGELKHGYVKSGYARVSLYKHNKSTWKTIHRLLAEHFIPNPNKYPFVCHNDGDTSNNHVSNLYWGTAKMNAADTLKHGTRPIGDKHWKAKLTEKEVIRIRELSDTKQKSYSQLSKLYGVSKSHIGLVVQRKSWKHIKRMKK